MYSTIITRSAKRSESGSHLQHCSKRSAEKRTATANLVKRMTEDDKKTTECMPPSFEAKFRASVHFFFDYQLSRKLLPGYTKLSMTIDDVSGPWVLNFLQPACVWKLRANEKHEHVILLLRAFCIRNSRCTIVFSSTHLVLHLRDMFCLYSTAASLYEDDLVTHWQMFLTKR